MGTVADSPTHPLFGTGTAEKFLVCGAPFRAATAPGCAGWPPGYSTGHPPVRGKKTKNFKNGPRSGWAVAKRRQRQLPARAPAAAEPAAPRPGGSGAGPAGGVGGARGGGSPTLRSPPARCAPVGRGEHQLAHLGGSARHRAAASGGRTCLPAAAAGAGGSGRRSFPRVIAEQSRAGFHHPILMSTQKNTLFRVLGVWVFSLFSLFYYFFCTPEAPGQGVRFKWEPRGSPGAIKPHSFSHPSQNLFFFFASVPLLQFA